METVQVPLQDAAAHPFLLFHTENCRFFKIQKLWIGSREELPVREFEGGSPHRSFSIRLRGIRFAMF